jgi:gliding motility-associated-like protein
MLCKTTLLPAAIEANFPENLAAENVMGNSSIVTSPVTTTTLCVGSSFVVQFTTSGTDFDQSNVFTAELSDATGSFNGGNTDVGSIVLGGSSLTSNQTFIYCTIPGSVPEGANYRIRVRSSLPAVLSLTPNDADITILNVIAPPAPTVIRNGPTEFCFGSASAILISSSANGNLWFPGGTNTNPSIGVASSSGVYYTQITGAGGCSTSSNPADPFQPTVFTISTPIFTYLYLFEDDSIASTAPSTVTICEGDSTQLGFLIEGGLPPYDIFYTNDGFSILIFENVGVPFSENTYVHTFYTSLPGIYQPQAITDSSNCGANQIDGTIIVQTAPLPVTQFSYEPFCGSTSGVPVLASGFLGGGAYAFNPATLDGALVDANTGVLSNVTIGSTYSVEYTVDGPFCVAQSTTTVTVDSVDIVSFSIEPFCAGSDSEFPVTAAGFQGGGAYSFLTVPADAATINAVSGIISNPSPLTTYNIVYTSPAGQCQTSFDTTVTTLDAPVITGSVVEQTTCNDSLGVIETSITGGVAPYSILWTTGDTTANINGLVAGSYSVIVTDDAGCTATTSYTIENSNQPEAFYTPNDAACGGSNGSIVLDSINGVGPFTYDWTDSDSTSSGLSGLSAGSYEVTITDVGTTCELILSFEVEQQNAPILVLDSTNQTLCGLNEGAIYTSIQAGTGTAPFTYEWTPSVTQDTDLGDAINLGAGSYSLTITDDNGCTASINGTISNDNEFVASDSILTTPTCGNLNGGSIDISTQGGDAPFTYEWSNSPTAVSSFQDNLAAGTYTIIVRDEANCDDTLSVTIAAPPVLTADSTVTPTNCNQSTGSISVNIIGGSGSYGYAWSNTATTSSISNLAVGAYTLVVTDSSDATCSLTLSFNIVEGNKPVATYTPTPTSCTSNTGTIEVNVVNDSGDLTFVWSGPDFTLTTTNENTLTGLANGTYLVRLTDNVTTCVVEDSVEIGLPNAPVIDSIGVFNTTCGNDNGVISILITGGTVPFNATFNGNPALVSSQEITVQGLAAGTYSFVLIDASGCEVSDSIDIEPSLVPSLETTSINPTCSADTGSINVVATNFTPTVNYSWTLDSAPLGDNTSSLDSLGVGQYIVTVTDAAGCLLRDTVQLQFDNLPIITLDSFEDTQCDTPTGAISVTVSEGTEPYSISWTGSNSFSANDVEDLTGLEAGCYTITVTDGNTCEVTLQQCIENLDGPQITFNTVQPSCNLDNGSVVAIVSGGSPAYTFSWINSLDTDSVLADLGNGTYTLTVTDNNGCTDIDSVSLSNTGILTPNATQTSVCGNATNGQIALFVVGGVQPYSYEWEETGDTTSIITGLGAGTYNVTITDAAGCSLSSEFTIVSNPVPSLVVVSTNPLCGADNGSINVTVNGGSGNYGYQWTGDNVVQGVPNQTEILGGGAYTVTVTDLESLCTADTTVTLENSNGFVVDSVVVNNTQCGLNNGKIQLFITGGVSPITVNWCNGSVVNENLLLENLAPGACQIVITDNEGCSTTLNAVIEDSEPITASVTTAGTTCDLCNGSAQVSLSLNAGAPSFLWSNGSTLPILNGVLCAGDISVEVTDANGCIANASGTVDSSSTPFIAQVVTDSSSCGESIGNIYISVTGGTGAYTYEWSGPGVVSVNNDTLLNLAAGNYSLTVTDESDCQVSTSIQIFNDNEPIVTLTPSPATCGNNDGSILLTIENETDPEYVWTGPGSYASTEQSPINLASGIYNVTVTDGSCSTTTSTTVINSDGPTATLSLSNDTICNGTDVILTVQLTGDAPFTFTYNDGVLPVTVAAFDGTTYLATVTPGANTTYTITSIVSDANPTCLGSIVNGSVSIVVNPTPPQPTITASGSLIFCEGGSVTLTSSSQVNNFWNITGIDQLNQSITVTTSGAYSVAVVNNFGCADTSESIVVEVLPADQISANNDTTVCAGSVLQFNATGGTNYVWSPSIYLSGTIIANPVCIPFETTTYVVTGSSTCGSGSDTIVVTVNPIVDTDLGDDITVCQNEALVLSVENVPGASYLWGPAEAIVGSNSSASATINTSISTEVYVQTTNTNGCVFSDTIQVNITLSNQTFNITANGSTTFCEGESLVLQASTGNLVNWSNGLQNFDQILVTESGSYSAIFTGGNCPAYSDTIEVTVIPAPSIEILTQGSTTICDGNCVTLNSSETSNITWTSPNGATSSTATLQACIGGWYYLSRIENGCTGTDSILISVAPAVVIPSITLDGSSVLCDGQTTATLTSSYALGNQWFLNGDPITGATSNSIEVSAAGSYTVVVTSPEGCTAISTAQGITVKPVVPIDVTAADTVVCNDEVVNIQLSATGGFVSYFWDVTGETTSSITAINTGIFTVTGTTADGCVSNASIQIINNSPFELNLFSPIFFDDFNVSAQGAEDGSIDLTVFGGSGVFTYDWSNGGTTSDLSGLSGGIYSVTVADEQGCTVTDSINLKEPEAIKLPNGFTPNGDGFNDFYVIKGIQGYPGNKVNIFNRWGNLVFSTQDYQNNWGGVSNDGNLLPDGTYFIVVDLNKEGTDNVENYIDLRRN